MEFWSKLEIFIYAILNFPKNKTSIIKVTNANLLASFIIRTSSAIVNIRIHGQCRSNINCFISSIRSFWFRALELNYGINLRFFCR